MADFVLLHGIGGCGGTWQPQVEHFSRSGKILAWSAPGFGGKPQLEDLSFQSLAAQLAEDMDEAGIDDAGGNRSFLWWDGGTQQFVKDFPDRVSHLVLVGTSPAFGNPEGDFQKTFVAETDAAAR